MYRFTAQNFTAWRAQARELISKNISPTDLIWDETPQQHLFATESPASKQSNKITVPPAFLLLAEVIACHRSENRWNLLYRLLWRLTHGEKHLLQISTDPLMHELLLMQKAIRRDAHKTKAFVRFRLVQEEQGEHYIAWHRPDHRVLPLVSSFFARRFAAMMWTILTPDESLHWDGTQLIYGPGVDSSQAPQKDDLEDLWRSYYRATFNPARIKIKAMKREMPVRHWQTLPETDIIVDMLAEAPLRVEAMIAHQEGSKTSAAEFMPKTFDLTELRQAAASCEGCELYRSATQTVFGEGPNTAQLMLVGEQPGNDEDLGGRPFIGPAGEVLDGALEHAGINRGDIYITNAVKHFRFVPQGNFRRHVSPARSHVSACKPWLDAEIDTVKPRVIVCLGNTAAKVLINPGFTMKTGRGRWYHDNPIVLATYHPSSILRALGNDREEQKQNLYADLKAAVKMMQTVKS